MGSPLLSRKGQHEVSPGGGSPSGPQPLLSGGDEEAEEEPAKAATAAGSKRKARGSRRRWWRGWECTEDELECLRQVIPGEPKEDYPIYAPSFLCKLNPKN